MKTSATLDKAEGLLKDLEAASRGRRLSKAEAEIKSAAKPKTRAGRGVAIRQAEADVKGSKPHDPRCIWRDMRSA